jgi:hypothetical protein
MSNDQLAAISAKILKFEQSTILNVIEIGRLLREARELCEHGEYQEWIERAFVWSYRSALRYSHAAALEEKCQCGTFERLGSFSLGSLNLSLSALHIVADPSMTQEECEAILERARTFRVTVSVANEIICAFPFPDDTGDAAADPIDDESGDPPDDLAPISDQDEERTEFLDRIEQAISAADYHGPVDEEVIRRASSVANCWARLVTQLSEGRIKGAVISAADRAEARAQAARSVAS